MEFPNRINYATTHYVSSVKRGLQDPSHTYCFVFHAVQLRVLEHAARVFAASVVPLLTQHRAFEDLNE